jgi:transposase
MNEPTRYDEFCQFRQEIRGSSEHLIVGIDVAKGSHRVFFGSATGRSLLRRLTITNSRAGFEQLLERTDQIQRQHGLPKAVYVVEPTGNYHKPLAHWLQCHDQMVVLVSNKAIAENRETMDGRWDKNDTKDSANAADLVAQAKCQFFQRPDAAIRALRTLLSLRERLKKDEHAVRMQIRNGLVATYFPEFDSLWGSCLHENIALVRECLSPRKIVKMGFDAFVRTVASRDRGAAQLCRLQRIYVAAEDSIGCAMDEEAEFEARIITAHWSQLRQYINDTDARISTLCGRFDAYPRLLTIPGFGPFVAAQVVGHIGDPFRFKAPKQVIRLAGYDLNAKRSGIRSDRAIPIISKRGNASLRYALYQAALTATCHDPGFRTLFTRYLQGREKERGIRTKARVKLATKMVVIAWTIMKNGQVYNPSLLEVTIG